MIYVQSIDSCLDIDTDTETFPVWDSLLLRFATFSGSDGCMALGVALDALNNAPCLPGTYNGGGLQFDGICCVAAVASVV